MTGPKYDQPRPNLPAEVVRSVEVESGHACAVHRCSEHTYLEVHHINQNREDNRLENLILLCDKHHKMAHAGVIDRKALAQYKKKLTQDHVAMLAERLARLEALIAAGPAASSERSETPAPTSPAVVDPGLPTLSFSSRAELSALTLEELALSRFEKERGLLLRRHADLRKGDLRLNIDALHRSGDGLHDLLVEVRWIRKLYLDAPVWVRQVEAATEAYELFTGCRASAVLILVTPNRQWARLDGLPFTSAELAKSARPPEVVIYNYDQLGFEPAPLSVDAIADQIAHAARPKKIPE